MVTVLRQRASQSLRGSLRMFLERMEAEDSILASALSEAQRQGSIKEESEDGKT